MPVLPLRDGGLLSLFPPFFFDQIYDRFETHAGEGGGSSDDPPPYFRSFAELDTSKTGQPPDRHVQTHERGFFCNVPFFGQSNKCDVISIQAEEEWVAKCMYPLPFLPFVHCAISIWETNAG